MKAHVCWISHRHYSIWRDTRFLRPCKESLWWLGWRRKPLGRTMTKAKKKSTTVWLGWDTSNQAFLGKVFFAFFAPTLRPWRFKICPAGQARKILKRKGRREKPQRSQRILRSWMLF